MGRVTIVRRVGIVGRVFLALLVCNAMAHAETNWEYLDQSPEPIIGLLDLPDIVGDGCGTRTRATSRASATPSQSGAHVGTIFMRDGGNAGCGLMLERVDKSTEDLPTLESGYEIGAAIVYERRGQWYRIALKDRSAWIQRTDSQDFLSYPDTLHRRLAYIAQGWDGVLRATPGPAGETRRAPPGVDPDRSVGMTYLGSQRIGKDLWIHVQLMTERCAQTVEGIPLMSGWILAYRPNGAPAAWFHSRGC